MASFDFSFSADQLQPNSSGFVAYFRNSIFSTCTAIANSEFVGSTIDIHNTATHFIQSFGASQRVSQFLATGLMFSAAVGVYGVFKRCCPPKQLDPIGLDPSRLTLVDKRKSKV